MEKSTVSIHPLCNRQIGVNDQSTFGGWTGTRPAFEHWLSRALEHWAGTKPIERVRFQGDDDALWAIGDPDEGQFVCTHAVVRAGEQVEEVAETRRPGEQPVTVRVVHRAERDRAATVELILYRHDVLAKDGDATSESDYELVSINCMAGLLWPFYDDEPMVPSTLWRNYLSRIPGCPAGIGGTFREEWADEAVFRKQLAASEEYWANKARVVVDKAE